MEKNVKKQKKEIWHTPDCLCFQCTTSVKKGRDYRKFINFKKVRKRKGKKITKPTNYKEYIRSEQWKQRRNRYYKTHKKECVVCKSKYKVGLHHMSYKNLGKEKDEDLVALCWKCHRKYHEIHGKADFDKTNDYIIEEQEVEELKQLVSLWK